MAKSKQQPQKKPTTPKRSWRTNDDRHHRSFPSWPSPESLRPDDLTSFKVACGIPEAKAITDAYQCRLPVVLISATQLETI